MNTEQLKELKQINTHLALIEAELGRIRVAIREASAPLPDGIIGNSSDSPYVQPDSNDLNHYMPKVGEVVLVATLSKNFVTRVFTQYDPSSKFPFMTVVNGLADSECRKYRMGLKHGQAHWLFCRRLNGEIIEFGCDKVKQPERNESGKTNPCAVDWTNAPDWADVHAFDEDGKGYWYGARADTKNGVLLNGRIRRLTPVECERLQGVRDNYTAMLSDTQRYRALGNGWTIPVIAHILSFMPINQTQPCALQSTSSNLCGLPNR